ncbi:MAG TPA: TetR/AcrR family transcriptional regulator [Solirubrobacteraceae bacterium]|jgi:AcrR family transcriptional regulator
MDRAPNDLGLRHVPTQARSRERLRRVLEAADEILAGEGAPAFTTTRIATVAGVPVGSVYRYFPDKAAIVEALALRYWGELSDLVVAAAESDERSALPDPAGAVLSALAAGFRARPGFLALWYGGLRTEAVRDATRPIRESIAASVTRILAVHWPRADPKLRETVARMVVISGDGLLREAFRRSPDGDPLLLAESRAMLDAYARLRLGESER